MPSGVYRRTIDHCLKIKFAMKKRDNRHRPETKLKIAQAMQKRKSNTMQVVVCKGK